MDAAYLSARSSSSLHLGPIAGAPGGLCIVLRWITAWAVVVTLLFGTVSEYLFWQEFTTRFNFIALDYLIYTHEVIGNITESYPVPLIVGGLALLASLIVWIGSRYLRFADTPYHYTERLGLLALALMLPLAGNLLANIDQAQINGTAYAQELAGNGLFNWRCMRQ